jgi:hypothetical protein
MPLQVLTGVVEGGQKVAVVVVVVVVGEHANEGSANLSHR